MPQDSCEYLHDGFRKTKVGTEFEISLDLIELAHITLKMLKKYNNVQK